MISKKKLITANAMSANTSGTTELGDTSPASHSPKSTVPQTHNEIRIGGKNLITEAVKLMMEFLSDVFGFLKNGVAGDGFGLWPAEVQEIIARRVLLEDVSSVEFGVKVPDGSEGPWVLRAVVAGEIGSVFGGEGDDTGVV